MITRDKTDVVEFPHEPGHSAVIRMLSWKQLETAGKVRTRSALAELKGVDIDMLKQLTADAVNDAEAEASLDVSSVLLDGVVSWTYDEPVTAENLDALDDVTKDFLFNAIRGFSRRTNAEGNV